MRNFKNKLTNKILLLLPIFSLALMIGLINSCENKSDGILMDKDNKVLVKVESDPTISFNIWVKVGSQNDPKGKEGLAYVVASLLTDGSSQTNSYEDIIEKLYPIAAGFSSKVDKEMTVIRGRVHKDNLNEYYPLLIEAVTKPAFKQEELDRIINNTINSIENDLKYSSDEELGKEILYNTIFAGTNYGNLTIGNVSSLKSITLDDVKKFYTQFYTKDNYDLGMGGGFDDELVEKTLADLNVLPAGKPEGMIIKPNNIKGLNFQFIEKENSATAISFGFPIDVLRGDDDFFALALFNSWFGEHRNQSSHLYNVIREQRGLNYGDYSYIEIFLNGGSLSMPDPNNARKKQIFEVWIRPVQHIHRHFALRAALRELQSVVDNGMTEEEFQKTKTFLNKYALHYAPTTEDRLGYQVDSKFYNIPDNNNYIQYFRDKIKDLSLNDVNKAIKKHIQYKNIQFAIITQNSENFINDLVNDTASPIAYETPKPESVMNEDKSISTFPIKIKKENCKITKVEELFK